MKILIIDDEKLLAKSTAIALNCYGFETIIALDGVEGLRKSEENTPDLILLDIMMPGMNGWEVLKQLKASEKTTKIPVVIFTAREYSDGKALSVKKGADAYLPKPFDLDNLIVIINSLKPDEE